MPTKMNDCNDTGGNGRRATRNGRQHRAFRHALKRSSQLPNTSPTMWPHLYLPARRQGKEMASYAGASTFPTNPIRYPTLDRRRWTDDGDRATDDDGSDNCSCETCCRHTIIQLASNRQFDGNASNMAHTTTTTAHRYSQGQQTERTRTTASQSPRGPPRPPKLHKAQRHALPTVNERTRRGE